MTVVVSIFRAHLAGNKNSYFIKECTCMAINIWKYDQHHYTEEVLIGMILW